MNLEAYSNDGVDHINAYSKSECELGRMLSNFYHYELNIDGIIFNSLEAYWYYLLTDDDSIAFMSGNEAKQYGKSLTRIKEVDEEFKNKFKSALEIKIETVPDLKNMLVKSTQPILHYYVTESGKRLSTNHEWLPLMIMDIRSNYQKNIFKNFLKR